MTETLSETREDYIRAIYILAQSSGSVGVTQISEKMGLSKSTVSERVKDLVRDGYAKAEPYANVVLTKKGKQEGEKLTYKHRIIEVFLNQTLGVPKSRVHGEAHKLEHACSDEVIQKLAKFLNHPATDPHGSEIPKIDNWK